MKHIHFVGFRGNEYISAIKVWGVPDFIHRINDHRMQGEISNNDIIIFANGSESKKSNFTFNDSNSF